MWLTLLSWGARAVPFLKSPKIAASILAVAGAVALWLYVGHLQNKIDTQVGVIAVLEATNEANLRTVDELEAANKSLADAIRIREDERIAAAAAAAERQARAEIQLDQTLSKMEELRHETPDCEELSKIDMGAVCPLVTERLRQHATGAFD
jgi:tRNA uridine 5-carbamoylmethylation protein Kti12